MEARVLLNNLPPFNNQKILIKKNQSVNDIIKALNVAHNQYKADYDKIAREFLGHSTKQTAYNIWSFLKKNVPYKAEPDTMQTIKSPGAIIKTGMEGKKSLYYNDCKNYSLFAGGILSALNRQGYKIPYVYRFASYNMFDQEPGHVFVVINPGEKEIWIDAVLKEFDYKKKYITAKDKNFDMMYSISGVDNVLTGNRKAKRQEKRAVRKTKRAQRRAEGKGFGQKIVKTIKKAGKAVLKVAAAPVRNSFLLLVKLNFRSLATNLKKADAKAPARLREFWEGAGGRYQNLLTAINQGSKKKRLGALGEPVTAATAATTAAPLLIKIASLLKKIGINPEDLGEIAKNVIQNKVQNAIERAEIQSEAAEQSAENTADQEIEDSSMVKRLANQNAVKLTNEEGQQIVTPAPSGMNKNILLIAGVGVAALLLMKKK